MLTEGRGRSSVLSSHPWTEEGLTEKPDVGYQIVVYLFALSLKLWVLFRSKWIPPAVKV